MKIVVDTNATTQRVEVAYNEALNSIKANAAKGVNTTEVYVDKDIYSDVMKKLETTIKGLSYNQTHTGYNEYTGRKQYYITQTVGDQKRFIARIPL